VTRRWTEQRWLLDNTIRAVAWTGTSRADWMASTLDGKTFPSGRWYVEASGRITITPT
jgi:hypothetical protein